MEANNEERGGGGGSKSSFLSRQSSTRWIPTSDQIRILRDLYYNTGLRSPSPEQIQRISARLRQYGKIEGKNVFYWFQNHKARERQKKRLTVDLPSPTSTIVTKYCTANMSPGVPSACSSPNLYGAGLMGTSGGYAGGSVIMEGNFRERFVSGGGDGGDLQAVDNNMGWMGLNTATMPWTSTFHYSPEHQAVHREMKTLPLFPIHSQEQQQEEREHDNVSLSQSSARNHIECNWSGKAEHASGYLPAFHWPDGAQKQQNGEEDEAEEADGEEEEDRFYVFNNHPFHHHSDGGGASLELTLNSYYYTPHGST